MVGTNERIATLVGEIASHAAARHSTTIVVIYGAKLASSVATCVVISVHLPILATSNNYAEFRRYVIQLVVAAILHLYDRGQPQFVAALRAAALGIHNQTAAARAYVSGVKRKSWYY